MNKKMFTKLFALVLAVCVVFSLAIIVSSADGDKILAATFELGTNGSAAHKDGSTAKTTYSETDGDYSLSITGGDKMYPASIDAKGNSCIKFGTSSVVGKMSFTVPDDVVEVKLYVAKYKANTTKINVNGTAYTLSKASNNGEYDVITVDTSATKTVSFTTVSGGVRAMLNTIEYYVAEASSEPENPDVPACEHANVETVTVDPTCTVAGSTTVTCEDCGAVVSKTTIAATGHGEYVVVETVDPTCTEKGSITKACEDCGDKKIETVSALGHTYEDGVCAECGEEEPNFGTLVATFDFGENGDNTVHVDGSALKLPAEYTNGEYILEIASGANIYGSAYDLQKNSCIKFGTSSKAGSMSFTVPDDVACVIIYLANYKVRTGTVVDINGVETTLVGQSDNGEYDAIVVDTTTVKTVSFAITSGYRAMMNTIEFYATAGDEDCAHENTTTDTTDATCTVDGSIKTTCDDCGYVVSNEVIEATGHGKFEVTETVAGTCTAKGTITSACDVCGEEKVETTSYVHNFVDGACADCKIVEAPKAGVAYKFGMFQGNLSSYFFINGAMDGYYMDTVEAMDAALDVYLEETDGGYYIYTYIDDAKMYINVVISGTYKNGKYEAAAATVYTYDAENYMMVTNIRGSMYAIGTRNDKTYNTVGPVWVDYDGFHCGFFATEQAAPAPAAPKFETASVKLGTDLAMLYTVSVPAGTPSMMVEFNGKTVEITEYTVVDGKFVFEFAGIAPQQMSLNIKATLYVDGTEVAIFDNYSVEKNLNNIKNAEGASEALIALVNSVLIYGDASENYVGIEGGVDASALENTVAENEATYTLANADEFGFTAANVKFDSMNKITVKFYVEGEFTITMNGAAVEYTEIAENTYAVTTDALTAKQFADEYTFVITVGETTATLTYSVNAYAAAMEEDAAMGELAKALYAYGVNAKAYQA